MRPLSNIQERVERSLEIVLHDALVIHGYTPDRYVYANNPAGYTAALASIKASKGFAIELFGHGASHDRDVKKVPRIVITGQGFYPGDTGNAFGPSYLDMGTHFEKQSEGLMFSNYRFEITLLSNSTAQDRILEAIRQAVLPNLGYIKLYDNPTEKFLIEYGLFRQNPDLIQGIIEKVYTYEAKDLKEQEPMPIEGVGPIAKIKEITIKDDEDQSTLIKKNSLQLMVNETSSVEDDQNTILN